MWGQAEAYICPRNVPLIEQLLNPAVRVWAREGRYQHWGTPTCPPTCIPKRTGAPYSCFVLQGTLSSSFSLPALPGLEGTGLLVGDLHAGSNQSNQKLIVRRLRAMAACLRGTDKRNPLSPELAPSVSSPLPAVCEGGPISDKGCGGSRGSREQGEQSKQTYREVLADMRLPK